DARPECAEGASSRSSSSSLIPASRLQLAQRRGVSSSHGDAEIAESEPAWAAFVVEPSVPRPDQRSYSMWFLPVGSRLIPSRRVAGEAGSTPWTLTRSDQTTTSQDP